LGHYQLVPTESLRFAGGPDIQFDGPIFSDAFRRADFADRRYEVGMEVTGVNHVNNLPAGQVSGWDLQDDGSVMNTDVRDGHIVTWDVPGDSPDRGQVLYLLTDDDNGRLRLNNVWDENNHITLGDLDELSFDYNVDFSTRTDVIPVIRLLIDADGDLSTTGDRGELVFEWAYQGFGPTTWDTWQTADLHGDDWNAWQRSNGVNWDIFPHIRPLSDWADDDGYTVPGGLHFDEDSVIFGWSIALGSSNGGNIQYLDNLAVGLITYDFE
jgi:hypothetical protein